MNWQPDDAFDGILLLLGKGLAWLALCGIARWAFPRFAPSWRLGLVGLLLLTTAGLLPSLWTWSLPAPVEQTAAPAINHTAIARKPGASNPYSGVNPTEPVPAHDLTYISHISWRSWWAMLWLGGSAGLLCWLLNGFRTARRWIRHAVPPDDPSWHQILTEESRGHSPRHIPELLVCQEVPSPCVAGCFRPVLLLPLCCQEWDTETRILVIRHELAHLRHRDAPHAWIRALTLTIHWPNPLVWLAISRSRHAEELAADAAVLASGIRPDHYAAVLLRVAHSCQFTTQTPLVTAMAHSSNLESRIRQLLVSKLSPQSPARFAAAGIGLTFITAGFIGCSSVEREPRDPNDLNLPGARTPNVPIDIKELKKLFAADPSQARRFIVKCRVIDLAGRNLKVPGMIPSDSRAFALTLPLRPGQKGRLEIIREFPFPTRFDHPKLIGFPPSSPEGSFPVTPTTPQEFNFRNIGWEATQVTVRQDGAWLMVSGTFRETTFDGFTQNAGEAFSPIITKGRNALGLEEEVVLTDNKVLSPAFTQRETPFTVAALPGKTYRLRLNLKEPDAFLEITCTPEKE